jgi:Fe-S cluster assembly iron-binding protein IscA
MESTAGLKITPRAAAELCRQAARSNHPGEMTLELVPGTCETWALALKSGNRGEALARSDGITLYGLAEQGHLLKGLQLDFKASLSGGGFLLRGGDRIRSCACGAAFTPRE